MNSSHCLRNTTMFKKSLDSILVTDAVADGPRDNIKDEISNETEKRELLEEAIRTTVTIEPATDPGPQLDSTATTRIDLDAGCPQNSRPNPKKKSTGTRNTTKHTQQGTTVFNINQSTGVHIGNNIVIQCGPSPQRTSQIPKETQYVKKIFQSIKPTTIDDIDLVSTHVGTNWKEVGRCLNYTDGQLEQFQDDNGRKGLKEVVFKLLLDWIQVNTSKATIGILCNALWTSKQHDAVQVLIEKFGPAI